MKHSYFKKHGRPPRMLIVPCTACGKEIQDYASNRTSAKNNEYFCSGKCRGAWVGIRISIQRGGDGRDRSKQERDKIYYRRNAKRIRRRVREQYRDNRTTILTKLQQKARRLKQEIINAYGGECNCCGEDHFEFLTIDHTFGDGAEHRRQCGVGIKIYADLKKRGFPRSGYRLLCLNCNISLGFYGYCPHKPHIKRVVDKSQLGTKVGRTRTVA